MPIVSTKSTRTSSWPMWRPGTFQLEETQVCRSSCMNWILCTFSNGEHHQFLHHNGEADSFQHREVYIHGRFLMGLGTCILLIHQRPSKPISCPPRPRQQQQRPLPRALMEPPPCSMATPPLRDTLRTTRS